MKYATISLILYAVAFLLAILYELYSKNLSQSYGSNFSEGFTVFAVFFIAELLVLICAVVLSILACIKGHGIFSKIPFVLSSLLVIILLLNTVFQRPYEKFYDRIFHKKEFSLHEISDKINENLPKMIDETVRMDTVFSYSKHIIYVYTVLDPLDDSKLAKIINSNSDNQKLYYENCVTVHYEIFDSDGKKIAGYEYDYSKKQKK